MTTNIPVLIIGSGPAGLTAAIYAARASLEPLIISGEPSSTGDQPGGQLMITTEVENYPGFPDGVMGPELMNAFKQQAEKFGSQFLTTKVTKIDLSNKPFQVWVANSNNKSESPDYAANSIIISTGAKSLLLNLPNELELMGRGVSACATCDGFFFKDENIAVIGGGDSAMEEALFLTKFAKKVTVIHRRDELRASKIMSERALNHPKIDFIWNTDVTKIVGSEKLEHIEITNNKTNKTEVLEISGMFVAIGHQPNTSIFKDQIDMDSKGYILTNGKTSTTSVEGVFACGDVQDPTYQQAITAAGSGCIAAMDAENWLEQQI